MSRRYDVVVVGAGIIGLAHALAAARAGLSVAILERGASAQMASVRNFGFVTVTGQAAGDAWQKARRTRDVWVEVAAKAGIQILHEGLVMTARRPESEAVIDAFLNTEMGEDCHRLAPQDARKIVPALSETVTTALHSPHEVRVESRTAIPALTAWLQTAHGVDVFMNANVTAVAPPHMETALGPFRADQVVVCPGAERNGLFAGAIAAMNTTDCKLQMMRVAPERPLRLGAAVMSDLGLARYQGYAALPEAAALAARLDGEQADHRAAGIHLIAVQSADGTLVVGDSHHYGHTLPDVHDAAVDELILGELTAVLDVGPLRVRQTWNGIYPSGGPWLHRASPAPGVMVVVVAAGCGASTAFAIGEETMAALGVEVAA
ncbi:MAG: TIGR03364 family FAD-dependent oxidoreductase [Pseudomonadota bacterium]